MVTDGHRLHGRGYRPDAIPEAVLQAWRSQCEERFRFCSPFYSPAFTRAVAEVKDEVYVCVLEQDDAMVGVLPFQLNSPIGRRLGVLIALVPILMISSD